MNDVDALVGLVKLPPPGPDSTLQWYEKIDANRAGQAVGSLSASTTVADNPNGSRASGPGLEATLTPIGFAPQLCVESDRNDSGELFPNASVTTRPTW